jgi:hypothetical protein
MAVCVTSQRNLSVSTVLHIDDTRTKSYISYHSLPELYGPRQCHRSSTQVFAHSFWTWDDPAANSRLAGNHDVWRSSKSRDSLFMVVDTNLKLRLVYWHGVPYELRETSRQNDQPASHGSSLTCSSRSLCLHLCGFA